MALLLVLLAAWGSVPGARAASHGKHACAAAKPQHARRCVIAAHRRRASRSAQGLAPRRAALRRQLRRDERRYSANDIAIPQLAPALRPRRISTLRFDDGRDACGRPGDRNGCRHERNLADALIQPPSASTARILLENGIPAIPEIPPIVILHAPEERWTRDILGRQQQQQ
jgi:hypothetical protein